MSGYEISKTHPGVFEYVLCQVCRVLFKYCSALHTLELHS